MVTAAGCKIPQEMEARKNPKLAEAESGGQVAVEEMHVLLVPLLFVCEPNDAHTKIYDAVSVFLGATLETSASPSCLAGRQVHTV